MKLLFDENLSRKLVVCLSDLYAGSRHVADFGLLTRPDEEVWDCAAANGFVLVSADSDFFERATTLGPPPKVIWLRDWKYSTRDVEALRRREAIRVATFVDDPDLAILMLDRG